MGTKKYSAVEVYAKLFGIKAVHKHLGLFTDPRSERGMLSDYVVKEADISKDGEAWLEANNSADMEAEAQRETEVITFADRKIEWRETQRVSSSYDDGEGGSFKDTRHRLTKKKSN